MSSNTNLAREAFFSLDRKMRQEVSGDSGLVLPPDLLEVAESFVERALNLMHERGTRDPRTHARMSAEEAVIRYVKLRMMGEDPDSDPVFQRLLISWSKVAARDDIN